MWNNECSEWRLPNENPNPYISLREIGPQMQMHYEFLDDARTRHEARVAYLRNEARRLLQPGYAQAAQLQQAAEERERRWAEVAEGEKRRMAEVAEGEKRRMAMARYRHLQPSHAQPSRSQPSRAQPSHAQSLHTQPSHAQPSHAQSSHAQPLHTHAQLPPSHACAQWQFWHSPLITREEELEEEEVQSLIEALNDHECEKRYRIATDGLEPEDVYMSWELAELDMQRVECERTGVQVVRPLRFSSLSI